MTGCNQTDGGVSASALTLREWLSADTFDCALNPSFFGVFTQLGCLGALQRESLLGNLCGLAGCSAGAMSSMVIASGRRVLDTSSKELALHADLEPILTYPERRCEVLDLGVGLGLLKGCGVETWMGELCLPTFEELVVPFACTAWSLWSMKTEILKTGPVPRAVRASMTVPFLFQPCRHQEKWLLVDGGLMDHSGSMALKALPKQPKRTLHVVVNRNLTPLFSHFARVVPPSRFGADRSDIVTLRLNNPPTLFFDDTSFRSLDRALLATAAAVLEALDRPMKAGAEDGHFILEVDVAWPRDWRSRCPAKASSP